MQEALQEARTKTWAVDDDGQRDSARAARARAPALIPSRSSHSSKMASERVIGVHLNSLVTFPSGDPADMAELTDAERDIR